MKDCNSSPLTGVAALRACVCCSQSAVAASVPLESVLSVSSLST